MERDYKGLLHRALALGASEARLLDTKDIVFDPRAFLKCRFGCARWGRYWTCPPNLGISQETFQEAVVRYKKALVVMATDPKSGQEIALAMEKEAMVSYGCHFAFAMALCVLCEQCAFPEPCRFPHLARPSMDARPWNLWALKWSSTRMGGSCPAGM